MSYVSDAFTNLKSNLEITATEQQTAARRRQAIYDHLDAKWDIAKAFLTGSYDRHTKTKKLKDVDIFVLVDADGDQGKYLDQHPSMVLTDLRSVLESKYPGKVTVDGPACVVSSGGEDEILSFEVVPAFERTGGGFLIPDPTAGNWMATDPTQHAEATTTKNKACDGKWVPFIKMVKGINREAGEPVQPSFLLEVMALDIVRTPFGRYQDEIVAFLASAADQIVNDWPDPGGIGASVNRDIPVHERRGAADACRQWQLTAEEAIDLEDDGSDRAAVDKWRELFGNRMPRPR